MNINTDLKNYIVVKGAKENNLKNIDVNIPKNKLVIITGLSGSGKSSLAFNTIYVEGQRRYIQSLSSYARQFLGNTEKPNVESIEGLSPAISIEQKTTSHNPRSTVGTVTEIYDYLRLIFARIGKSYCPNGHGIVKTLTISKIINNLNNIADQTKVQVLAPIVINEKGTFANKLNELKMQGYLRVLIDNILFSLDEEIILDKNKKHNIDIVIDRIIYNNDNETASRFYDAIEKAIHEAKGNVKIIINDQTLFFSINHSCDVCKFSLPELEPRLFSFNSPIGACKKCKGLGKTLEPDINKLVTNPNLSINEGAINYFKSGEESTSIEWQKLLLLLKHYNIDPDIAFKKLSKKELNYIFHGSDEPIEIKIVTNSGNNIFQVDYIEGVFDSIKRKYYNTSSESAREYYSIYMSEFVCDLCHGQRLSDIALSVKIAKKNIIELTNMSIQELMDFILQLDLDQKEAKISNLAFKEITNRLSFLIDVGLEYLTLSRTASTLSSGESQRIRLATQIGSALTGVLYVLDEPSIGLHQKDNQKLINSLKKMRDLGNSLIIVEHDLDTMLQSDWIIDIGPGAGKNGGFLVAQGNVEDIKKNENSITGNYLANKKAILIPPKRRTGNNKYIKIKNASGNNLKNVNLTLPLGMFVAITGVSGSGKSSLINETLIKAIEQKISNPFTSPLPFQAISGVENIDKIVKISQDPIGRTPRSNPATYISVFDDIRELYANTTEAKSKGYQKGRFSFNVKGGRCENCQGDGVIKIEMHFLPNIYVKCEDCDGKKYNRETLSVLYKGKNIYEILEMDVDSALDFFKMIPNIKRKLQLMHDVGLGYLKLGLCATNLSGGEAQRIKIAKFLQRRPTTKTIYCLDEPTSGLHIEDIAKLITVLNKIVDNGDSVIVIEHNLDLIKVADYIIDLGPDGGEKGGQIIGFGTPEQLCEISHSYTGQYLKNILKKIST